MADMICHKVYELLMSILRNVNEPYSIIAKPAQILGIFEQTTYVTAI
jgi:hypothetical protein